MRARAFACRFAYGRAAETVAAGDVGQDYLTFEVGDRCVMFALCDGVSQSFYGELAARFLGERLVHWLKRSSSLPADLLQCDLQTYLQDLARPGTDLVDGHPVPPDLPVMLREVLEQKRKLGSETTFVCARLDLPGFRSPCARLLVAWMGDSRVRIWGAGGEMTAELGGRPDDRRRWSTQRGAVGGDPSVFAGSVDATAGFALAAYSDGLGSLDTYASLPTDAEMARLIESAGKAAASDDISFLEVRVAPRKSLPSMCCALVSWVRHLPWCRR